MNVVFDTLAKEELTDAIEYYEVEMRGLGVRFKEETARVLRIIKKMPEIGSLESKNIRRYLLHKFPYKILALLGFLWVHMQPSTEEQYSYSVVLEVPEASRC